MKFVATSAEKTLPHGFGQHGEQKRCRTYQPSNRTIGEYHVDDNGALGARIRVKCVATPVNPQTI